MNSWISFDPFSLIVSQTPISSHSSSTFMNYIRNNDYNASLIIKTINFDCTDKDLIDMNDTVSLNTTLIEASSPSNWINMIVPSTEVNGTHISIENQVIEFNIKNRGSH